MRVLEPWATLPLDDRALRTARLLGSQSLMLWLAILILTVSLAQSLPGRTRARTFPILTG